MNACLKDAWLQIPHGRKWKRSLKQTRGASLAAAAFATEAAASASALALAASAFDSAASALAWTA